MPAFGARAAASFSAPTTPLFSPIPFLHEDPRRSASRSPPPLALAPASARLGDPPAPAQGEIQALGLVDEMDDPGPGHMSDHPTAISSVTTVPDGPQKEEEEEPEEEAGPPAKKSKPLLGTLEDRFVSSTKEKEDEKMEVDADGDGKEKPDT
jgi:serine/threonine-protein phosphatase 4 regulatory subunit 2